MTIRPGEKVICVNDDIPHLQYIEISKGETYTVRWVGPCRSYLAGDYIGVRLEGINRGVCPGFGEEDPPYRASRFRPLVEPGVGGKVKEEELV